MHCSIYSFYVHILCVTAPFFTVCLLLGRQEVVHLQHHLGIHNDAMSVCRVCKGEGGGGEPNFFMFRYAARAGATRLLGTFGGMLPENFFQNDALWSVLEYILINKLSK